jgi:predicted acyl esterase
MSRCPFFHEHYVKYNAQTGKAIFEYEFDEKTELTGHTMLKLWVEAIDNDDMDLFVIIEKFDRSGHRVTFPIQSVINEGPAALGWLRVSHRELDEEKSTFYQPVLKHQRELKLKPGEIVPVKIEIWPTSILFHRGEKLQLIIQGHDYEVTSKSHAHPWTINKGEHVIHTGGKHDSFLQIPTIPPKESIE